MHFQSEFYVHIIAGMAGEASPLMARLALNAGHDSLAFPFGLEELRQVGQFERKCGTQGLNEFFATECARATILGSFAPWDEAHVARLKAIADQPLPLTVSEKHPFSWEVAKSIGSLG